jgi:hypothetical protein
MPSTLTWLRAAAIAAIATQATAQQCCKLRHNNVDYAVTDRLQTTQVAAKQVKSHALRLRALPAAQTNGNVSITACATIRPPSSTADTAVPTRAGSRLVVPLTYAHTVKTSRVFNCNT